MTSCDAAPVPVVVEPDVDVPADVRAASRAFASPLRVAMLHALAQEALSTAELVAELDLPTRQTLPANLRALEEAGAITGMPAPGHRRGRTVRWRTDTGRVRQLAEALQTFASGRVPEAPAHHVTAVPPAVD